MLQFQGGLYIKLTLAAAGYMVCFMLNFSHWDHATLLYYDLNKYLTYFNQPQIQLNSYRQSWFLGLYVAASIPASVYLWQSCIVSSDVEAATAGLRCTGQMNLILLMGHWTACLAHLHISLRMLPEVSW